MYKKFVDFAYKDRCFWYRTALIESKLSYEHQKEWQECLACLGDSIKCQNYDKDPLGELENILKTINLNSIGGII